MSTNARNYISFTLDLRMLANVASQDPTCREELIAGINDADQGRREPSTSQLGAANLTPGEGTEDTWASLFVATKRDVPQGVVSCYRNDAKSSHRGAGDGPRIQMRLRRQPPKEQLAQTPGLALPAAAPAPAGVDLSNPAVAALLAQIAALTTAGQVPAPAVATVPAPAPAPAPVAAVAQAPAPAPAPATVNTEVSFADLASII